MGRKACDLFILKISSFLPATLFLPFISPFYVECSIKDHLHPMLQKVQAESSVCFESVRLWNYNEVENRSDEWTENKS